MCFTPRCLDCFLFLHAATAATKLRIPIGRHRNPRHQQQPQHGNMHFPAGVRFDEKRRGRSGGAQCNRRQQQQQIQETPGHFYFSDSCSLEKHRS